MSDYRTLLAEAIDAADRNGELDALHDVCVTMLATRVPWLCSAPTIADLLRWGEQYPKVRADLDHVVSCPEVWCDRCDLIESDTLAALRGEGQ